MKNFKFAIICLVSICCLSGCFLSGKNNIPNYMSSADQDGAAGDFSYVILGAELDPKSDVSSYLYSMLYNGNPVGMQGVVKEGSREFWTAHHHFNYVKTDSNNHAYLIWKIPASSMIESKNEALVYLSALGGEKDVFFYFDYWKDIPLFSQPGATGMFPFAGTLTPSGKIYINSPVAASEEPPLSDFKGLELTIEKNKIYYLGESTVEAGILKKESDSTFIAGVKPLIKSDMAALKKVVKQFNLPAYKVENLSGKWGTLPINVYLTQSRKNIKK